MRVALPENRRSLDLIGRSRRQYSGALNVHIASGPFPPFLCYIAYPGWWTGEAAAATDTPRRVEQVARFDSHVQAIPTDKLRRLANDDPETWRRLEQITVAHMDHALELACIRGGSDKRLAVLATLRRLAVQFPRERTCVAISVNQSEIAEMSGLSRNSVGPVLSDLVRENIIIQQYRQLKVDRQRLETALS